MPEDGAFRPDDLLANIAQQKLMESHAVNRAVIDNLQDRLDRAEAELRLIRFRIDELLDGQYMPSAKEIDRAVFHPDRRAIDQLAAEAKRKRERAEKNGKDDSTQG